MNLIYTVNFNDYDSVKPISFQSSKTDCICVTDRFELKNGNVYLIVTGISSLLLYAKQMGVNTYMCKAKTQRLKFAQNRMIKLMSEVGE